MKAEQERLVTQAIPSMYLQIKSWAATNTTTRDETRITLVVMMTGLAYTAQPNENGCDISEACI